jgi:cation:H+ antiporter
MFMHMDIIFLIVGLIGLWFGSGLVIEGAKKLALKYNISHTLIGLTIISIGTSLPEIFTNVFAGLRNLGGDEASGIAVGTNIGSCLTQITLILGIIALIGTMKSHKKTIYRDGGMVLVAIISMFVVGLDGLISRTEGLVLVVAYVLYLIYIVRDEDVFKNILKEINNNHSIKKVNVFHNIFFIVIGLGVLVGATHFVVDSAIKIATRLDLAQSFIGVMIIGVGTGLPELSTALRGVLKGANGISLGTLIGSNVTDPMFSLWIGAMIAGFKFDPNLLWFDVPFWFIVSIIALFLISRNLVIKKKEKGVGLTLIGLYVVFLTIKVVYFT